MDFETCFICQTQPLDLTQETPYQWLEPRTACAKHKARAVLENGELVSVVLNRLSPLEGSLLNFFLNPVTIEGVKGWCDYVAGWYEVHEEIFPCRNYFEFYAQHATKRQNLDYLYAFYKQREDFTKSFRTHTLMKALFNIGNDGHQALIWLEHLGRLEKTGQRALASGAKHSLDRDKLEAFMATTQPPESDDLDELLEVTSSLLPLAEVRFAHLRIEN